ncbi:exodeoxyribonuclease VII large subunit [Oceanospirillum sediminis]|uniref:Exodeoxyribonuclease 7 large subunit n=1 Tax=Oceanospirillum sediminis TaxID=2760088 RepID=A0A839IQM2_9GAMM|nr:exodeoxyribonuclease VII large subunit [Oceanospirillum sediminis]MBB1486964.1 exodeoxyribonuclease VII large subunit [Oceanospirillum sediminis]
MSDVFPLRATASDPAAVNTASSVRQVGQSVLTVSELNRKVRQLLEGEFALLVVQGEISNLSTPGSGHLYFTLKDDSSQVRCAMFRNRASLLAFRPANGQKVQLHARVSLYEGRGDFQLIAETMEEQGHGALMRAYEALKRRLKEEGLFDRQYKKPLPPIPNVIGLVTSPTGAAIRDMLTVLKRRFPLAEVVIYPAVVQGTDAPDSIARAIELAHLHDKADLLIVGRGGGSLEDLWAFNDERVARAIFAAHIPLVSAVGHESDITIADYVADLRAPTPSAAAELISPDLSQWQDWLTGSEAKLDQAMIRRLREQQQKLDYLEHRYQRCYQSFQQQKNLLGQLEKRLNLSIKQVLQKQAMKLEQLQGRLKHPEDALKHQAYQLEHLQQRLIQAAERNVSQSGQTLQWLRNRLLTASPEKQYRQAYTELDRLEKNLNQRMQQQMSRQQQLLVQLVHRLNTVSPLSTLARGYAIVEDTDGRVIHNASTQKPGDSISARLAQGILHCEVRSVTDTEISSGLSGLSGKDKNEA